MSGYWWNRSGSPNDSSSFVVGKQYATKQACIDHWTGAGYGADSAKCEYKDTTPPPAPIPSMPTDPIVGMDASDPNQAIEPIDEPVVNTAIQPIIMPVSIPQPQSLQQASDGFDGSMILPLAILAIALLFFRR